MNSELSEEQLFEIRRITLDGRLSKRKFARIEEVTTLNLEDNKR